MFLNSEIAMKLGPMFFTDEVNSFPFSMLFKMAFVVTMYYTGVLLLDLHYFDDITGLTGIMRIVCITILLVYNLLSLIICFSLTELGNSIARSAFQEDLRSIRTELMDINRAIELWSTVKASVEKSTLFWFTAQQILLTLAMFLCIADITYLPVSLSCLAASIKGMINVYSLENIYSLIEQLVKKAHKDAYNSKNLRELLVLKERANDLAVMSMLTG